MYQNAVEMGLGALPVYLPRLFLSVNEIAGEIKGIRSIAPAAAVSGLKSGSTLWWKKDSGIWQSRYPKVCKQCCGLSAAA